MEENPLRSHETMILSVSLGGTQDYGELVVMVCPSSYLGFLQLGFLKGSQSGSTNRIQRKGMNQKHKCPKPEDEFMLFCLQLQSS